MAMEIVIMIVVFEIFTHRTNDKILLHRQNIFKLSKYNVSLLFDKLNDDF